MAFPEFKFASRSLAGVSLLALGAGISSAAAASLNLPNGGTNNTNFSLNADGLIVTVITGTGSMTGDVTSGPGSLNQFVKRGTGTLVLSGNNFYAGGTIIEAGRVRAATSTALSWKSSYSINAGATLQIDNGVGFAAAGSLRDGANGGGRVVIGPSDPFVTLFIGGDDRDTIFSGSIIGEGSLEKEGNGTQVLTGVSNIGGDLVLCGGCDGALEIRGGTFTVRTGVDVQAGTLAVTDGGQLFQTDDTAGIIVSDRMIVDGLGSRVVADGLVFVGGIFDDASLRISGGATFDARSGALLGAIPGLDTTVLVTGAGSTWNLGEIPTCGCGFDASLVIGDGASLIVANGGTVNADEDIFVDLFGTIKIGNGGTGGTINAPSIFNDGLIHANLTGTGTLNADIDGSGELIKGGRGELILTGVNRYTGSTTVNNGLLTVNGSIISSDILVRKNGTLGGTGRVGDVTVIGTLAPGNSIGVLRVTGDLDFGANATYAIEVSPTAADRTNVTGAADLDGTVVVTYLPGTFITKSYTILHADGGLGGTTFDALQAATLPGIRTRLAYVGNDVRLITEAAAPDLDGLTLNERRALKTILDYFNTNGTLPAEFATLDDETLNLVTGELSTGAITAGILAADKFLDMLSDPSNGANAASGGEPIAYADQPDATASSSEIFAKSLAASSKHSADAVEAAFASRWKVWGGAYGGATEIDGEPIVIGSADVDARVFGIAGGIEHVFGNGAIGLALGGGTSSFELAGGLGSGDIGTFNAGVYVNQSFDNLYVVGTLAYGFHAVDTSRTVLGNTLRADFNAHSFSGRAEVGYRLDTPVATIAPYAAFQAINYQMPAYSEAGPGVFPLDHAASSTTATRIELGARVEYPIALDNGTVMKLTGRAAWAINGGTARRAVASFPSLAGDPFVIDGARPAQHAALIDAGAAFDFGNNLTAAVTFQGEFSSNVASYGAKAKFGFRW